MFTVARFEDSAPDSQSGHYRGGCLLTLRTSLIRRSGKLIVVIRRFIPQISWIGKYLGRIPMLKFGVIGYGYWGPNIVRNLRSLDGCRVVGICDQSAAARKRIQSAHPGISVHADATELLMSP